MFILACGRRGAGQTRLGPISPQLQLPHSDLRTRAGGRFCPGARRALCRTTPANRNDRFRPVSEFPGLREAAVALATTRGDLPGEMLVTGRRRLFEGQSFAADADRLALGFRMMETAVAQLPDSPTAYFTLASGNMWKRWKQRYAPTNWRRNTTELTATWP